jgi:chromosome segregation ATPase
LTPDEKRARSRQIDRNYSKAQDIYQGIINGDKLEPLERRIANNERIVREYNQRIRQALGERRELQVQIFNQGFYLKQQVDRGQLSQSAYDEMIAKEEAKYEGRVKALKADVGQWRQEVKTAKKRLADLTAKRRMIVASRPKLRRKRGGKQGARGPKVQPGERLLSSLRAQLRKLNAFQTKHTLNGAHPRDLGSRAVLSRAAPSADDDRGFETPPEEDAGFWED